MKWTILWISLLVLSIVLMLWRKQPITMCRIQPPSYSTHIVVARYKENIEWTSLLPNMFLYNKGPDVDVPSIPLHNVGREGHTYYHHIVTHYDNLPDAIVFLQGNPFDHSPRLFDDLQMLFQKRARRFASLSTHILSFDMINATSWHENLHSYLYKLPAIPKHMGVHIYKKLFGVHPPLTSKKYKFGCGAQFMVSKKAILRHPKSFYEKIVDLLSHSSNPVEGFVMERFHPLIFN